MFSVSDIRLVNEDDPTTVLSNVPPAVELVLFSMTPTTTNDPAGMLTPAGTVSPNDAPDVLVALPILVTTIAIYGIPVISASASGLPTGTFTSTALRV